MNEKFRPNQSKVSGIGMPQAFRDTCDIYVYRDTSGIMGASRMIVSRRYETVTVNIPNDITDTGYTYQLTSMQRLEFRSTIHMFAVWY